jgi:hypothetical protein
MPGNASLCLSTSPPRGRHRRSAEEVPDLVPDYGWAALFVDDLCRNNPELIGFVANAPPHTRHYVALAIIGAQQALEDWLAPLAAMLASRSRRAVLADVWGRDLGSTRLLARLGPKILPPVTYRALVTVCSLPQRRRAFADLIRPSERAIARLAEAPDTVIARYRGRLIGHYGAAGIAFLADGIQRMRPDLSDAQIDDKLNALEKPEKIEHLMTRLSRNLTLPSPPWKGNETITPLTTVQALRAAGLRLENCLNQFCIWNEALTGRRAFYLVEDKQLAVVALARHEVFGTWFVHSLARRRNRSPGAALKARIIEAFAQAGFPYFDGAPIGTAIGDDW